MQNNNKVINKKLGKVVVKINSASDVAEYIQAIGFLLSTVSEEHLAEKFTGQGRSDAFVFVQINNSGRLLQDLAEGFGYRLDDMAQFCHEKCGGKNDGQK